MIVKELLKKLSKMPQGAPVRVFVEYDGGCAWADDIDVFKMRSSSHQNKEIVTLICSKESLPDLDLPF